MRVIKRYAAFLIALLPAAWLYGAPQEFNQCFVDAAKQARDSVVNIIIYNAARDDGKARYTKVAYGSGTIITNDGYLVTNHHVVKKGNFYQIILPDGTEHEAKLLGNGRFYIADEKTDIAVMRIDDPTRSIRAIQFADSSDLSEGEWVLAIGNPYGLRQSVTSGIISSKGRSDIGFADIEDFIQTDAPINPGNSGGPLVNLQGKLIGINTAIRTVSGGYQGISFAIPSNIVRRVANELITHGRVRRGWVGFMARERRIFSRGERTVVEILSVMKDSPAEDAGIRKSDIIKSINGRPIDTLGELVKIISTKPVGSDLKITASRDGHLRNFTLLMREKDNYRDMKRQMGSVFSQYGIELDENARTGDVVISYLSPMKKGYRSGLKRGDIIVSLNGKKVASIDDFLNIYRDSASGITDVELYRGANLYTVEFTDDLE